MLRLASGGSFSTTCLHILNNACASCRVRALAVLPHTFLCPLRMCGSVCLRYPSDSFEIPFTLPILGRQGRGES